MGSKRTALVLPSALTYAPLRLKSLLVVYALVPGRSAAEDVFVPRRHE